MREILKEIWQNVKEKSIWKIRFTHFNIGIVSKASKFIKVNCLHSKGENHDNLTQAFAF